ncbi:hypothetical protein [Vagococcus jeotgali]|uniref:hypothetical protein n=1 Tax=Vagococcus jeotgali TaxID=3109030 RepID=UPI002DD8BED3|nr:hypothetical protein [Vagococcus sp. B2T-5]
MKKILISLGFLSIFLVGCSKSEITESKIIQSDGIYNYYKGQANEKIESITLTTQNGTVIDGQVNGTEFMTSSPALLTNEKTLVVINFENGDILEENIDFPKRKSIDNYKDFAMKMNLFISEINENAKTRFPESQSDGTSIISLENNVTTNVNIQDGQIIGVNLSTTGDANKEMATILAAFQTIYQSNNDGVAEAYNNTLETKRTNSFSSGGFLFTFSYNGENLFADIIKE